MNRQIVHLSQTLVIQTKIPQSWRQQLPSLYSTVLNSEGQRLFGFLMSPQTVLMVPFWWPQFGKYCLGDRRWEEEREQHGERGWPAQRWTSASSHLLELALTPLCGSHFRGTCFFLQMWQFLEWRGNPAILQERSNVLGFALTEVLSLCHSPSLPPFTLVSYDVS